MHSLPETTHSLPCNEKIAHSRTGTTQPAFPSEDRRSACVATGNLTHSLTRLTHSRAVMMQPGFLSEESTQCLPCERTIDSTPTRSTQRL
ncbi:hypothetical protein NDU88_003662 [Pleurodeles waltl]|uniref:Uncharacterized protein n=1 Tax=Pleurodeles waltl TaxID=8319 RepID=A0AAV7MSV3_PLEWA|nr:hypothetical protein NDU88_003662 [Pleurodeles waltl]